MKFIYGLLVVAAAAISTVSGQAYCSIQGFCAKEGERCDPQHYNYSTSIQNFVGVQCEYGTFCLSNEENDVVYPVCAKLSGLGEICNNGFSECGEPYTCYGTGIKTGPVQTCQMINYLGFGESCDSDKQCANNLQCVEGECQLYPNVKCQTGQCPYGQWCNSTTVYNVPTQCTNWLVFGAECDNDDQCAYDHYCGLQNNAATAPTCQPIFGKNEGDVCAETLSGVTPFAQIRPQCASGLTCSASTGTCQTIVAVTGTCGNVGAGNTASCSNDNCQCDNVKSETGQCRQSIYNFNANCQTSFKSIVKCAMDNKCPTLFDVNTQPDSCIMKNCGDLLCETPCDAPLAVDACGEVVKNPICNVPSSSSIVLPSFVMLIVAILALLL